MIPQDWVYSGGLSDLGEEPGGFHGVLVNVSSLQ